MLTFIRSAVTWTKAHGNQHGRDDGSNTTFSNSWDEFWSVVKSDGNIVRAPGVVDVPVCQAEEARQNWERYAKYTTIEAPPYWEYPCKKGEP